MQSLYLQVLATVLISLLVLCSGQEDDRLRGWNKAHGLWGKRSVPMEGDDLFQAQKRPENWAKLNTLWGKRSDLSEFGPYAEWKKRAQWQMANGLWGRR